MPNPAPLTSASLKTAQANDPAYASLITHLAQCQNTDEIDALLTALLTDKEQGEIANRIRIFDLLEQGITQRVISQQLGVGIATVSRGAKVLQQHDVSDLLTTLRQHNPNH